MTQRILLIESDPAVRNALLFSLGVEGYDVQTLSSIEPQSLAHLDLTGCCLVIGLDRQTVEIGNMIGRLTEEGARLPTIVLATNPGRVLREHVAAAGAILVEKPLIGDALTDALRALLPLAKAA